MPSASRTAAIASAWSAGSRGASSAPSAPSQSIASTPCRWSSRPRASACACPQPGCGWFALAATWRPAEMPPATSSTGSTGSPTHSWCTRSARVPAWRSRSVQASSPRRAGRTGVGGDSTAAGSRGADTAARQGGCRARLMARSCAGKGHRVARGGAGSGHAPPRGGVDGARPSSGGPTGPRRNWHRDGALPPSGCPGVVGPVPQPVSMDARSLPRAASIVNRFIRMKRWNHRYREASPPGMPHNSRMPIRPTAGAACAALLLAACASAPAPTVSAPAAAAQAIPTVAETWESARTPAEEIDSLATWRTPDGDRWLIASAKSTHRLLVYDGSTGVRLREVGGRGTAPGRFNRPNGLAVAGDHLFVVERDNHRVQVFALPGFAPLGSFGDDVLRSPYGIWLHPTEPGELVAYVTDSFMYGQRYDVVPPLAELDQRVRRFRVHFDHAGQVRGAYAGSFGDTTPEGALRVVESIGGDADNDRLLVADESRDGGVGGDGR